MFNDPHLESVRAEAMVRLLDSVVSVRRRYQFFVWMQNHLQSLLPHQVAVCGCYQRATRELGFEVFNSVVLTPAATGVLVDAQSPLLRAATSAWVRSGAQPVVVQLPGGSDGANEGMQALRNAGLVQFLAHGVARPQRPAELETFFLFASPNRNVSAAQSVSIELLMPYLHSMYLRVQSTEQEIGGSVASPSRPRAARALLTDRERQVLARVREGLSNQQIGEAMGISALTVKNHVQKLLRKLGAANRAQAVAKTSTLDDSGDIDWPQSPVNPASLPAADKARQEGGFTLLELLVVLVIIGLLAGYVGPKVFAQIGKSEVKVAKAQVDALQKALDQYRVDTGRYPSSTQGLQALVQKPADEPRWSGPYLMKSVPKDPWHRDYQYRQPGSHGDFDLLSLGRDGLPGGEGEDADVVSW